MFGEEIKQLSNSAEDKYRRSRDGFLSYMMSAAVAGFFIFVATILSNIASAMLMDVSPAAAKLAGAFLFSIAIILIVFIGGELFTGNNMTMAVGVYTGKVSLRQAGMVWLLSYIGNFLGILFLCLLFCFSGAQNALLTGYYTAVIPGKLGLTAAEYFLRGVLCNFLVCLAVFTGVRMKSESGKILVMSCVIASFVLAGFEHCIANMSTFTLGALFLGGLPWAEAAKSMLLVTLGNMVGGGIVMAFPVWFISKET